MEDQEKKNGRPPVDPARKRGQRMSCAVTATERAEIEARASAMDLTPGEFMRLAALGRRIPRRPPAPAVDRETVGRLGKALGGLSALARAAREGRVLDSAHAEIEALRRAVASLKRELSG